jgi:RNA polymerase sigma-70 factor, ECF subfamily
MAFGDGRRLTDVMLSDSPVATGQLDAMSDLDLLRSYAEGDKEAFGVLYQRHHDRLWAVAARITGPQDADDAVQNGMLRAYHAARSFRGESAVTTWLHRIIVNAAIDLTRRRPLVAEAEDEPYQNSRVLMADTRMDMSKQWLRLSPDSRAALLLVDIMGYPIADAAQLVSVPEGTMKSRAARARAAMAGKLGHLAPAQANRSDPPRRASLSKRSTSVAARR